MVSPKLMARCAGTIEIVQPAACRGVDRDTPPGLGCQCEWRLKKRAKTVVLVLTGGHAGDPKHRPMRGTWQFPMVFSRPQSALWSTSSSPDRQRTDSKSVPAVLARRLGRLRRIELHGDGRCAR